MGDVRLESPLPPALAAGRATALFLSGSGTDGARRLDVLVDGVAHRAAAAGMPRPDLGTRGGWWATVPVPARAAGDVVVLATAAGELARLPVVAPPAPAPTGLAAGTIAVALATFDPDPVLLRAQLESLRAQTDERWTCVISDDASSPEGIAAVREVVGDDPRFTVTRSEARRGFYRNFERALELVAPDAALVALCDQDDRWHPDKLATLRAALEAAPPTTLLAFSDQRLTGPDGRVLRDSLWHGRAVNHDDLASMLVANAVTGAATLFRRELLDVLLPFPDTPGLQFHDHWLGCAALAAGAVAYVDRPLYDYVQHGGAVFGDVTTGDRRRTRRSGRAAYFLGYLAREVMAQTLLARVGEHPDLRRFVAAQRSPAELAWLATRPRRATTLGTERELVEGVLWRWAAATPLVRDASFPDPLAFEQRALRHWRAALAQ